MWHVCPRAMCLPVRELVVFACTERDLKLIVYHSKASRLITMELCCLDRDRLARVHRAMR